MGINCQPEPSTSKLQPSPSTRAVLDLLAAPPAQEGEGGEEEEEAPTDKPSVADLAAFGIKVRDFAYESTLPPIAPFVRRQIQPGASIARATRPLKRTRRDGTEELDRGYGFVMGVARVAPDDDAGRVRKLRRTETGLSPPRREGALLSMEQDTALRSALDVFGGFQSQSQSQSQGHSLSQAYLQQSQGHSQQSQSQGYSQQSQGYSQSTSQDTDEEEFIATPFVTPNGSLQWIDGGDSPPLVPTEPTSVQSSTSRVRTPAPASPGPEPVGSGSGNSSPVPLARMDAMPPLPPSPTPPRATRRSMRSSPLSEAPSSSAPVPSPPSPPPPRYQLRKRTAPVSPVRAPKRRGRAALRRQDSLTVIISS